MIGATVTKRVHFATGQRGRKVMGEGPRGVPEVTDMGRVPRVARLMALAIKIEGLIASGAIADQAEAARLGHVTRARLTQVMNLLLLAPDIRLEILSLPRVREGRDPIVESHLRSIVSEVDWDAQRVMWKQLKAG